MANSNQSGGIGFCSVLTIVFIVLKLINVISWAWIWVLSPIWIPITVVLFFVVLFAILSSLN